MNYTVKEIHENLYLIRFDDRKTKYFEGLWEIPEGITYNSYLYLGDKKIVFDTVKAYYAEEYIEALKELTNLEDIDYIVIHHAEPDHTGALPLLLKEAKDKKTILSHPMTQKILFNLYGDLKFDFIGVKDGEERNVLGREDKLLFLYTSWLHWPETIVSYFKGSRILLTCDIFGGYSIPEKIDDSELGEYIFYMKKYLVTVIGNYIEWIPRALDKLYNADVKPRMILPSHGRIWTHNPGKAIDLYRKWSASEGMNNKILILYATMYGSSRRISEHINRYLIENGYETYLEGFDDLRHPSISDLLTYAFDSKAYIFIFPTYESDIHPIMMQFINILIKKVKSVKPVLIISPYGWSGIAGKKLSRILGEKKFSKITFIDMPYGSFNIESVKNVLDEFLKIVESS